MEINPDLFRNFKYVISHVKSGMKFDYARYKFYNDRMITGYAEGDDISLINTIWHKPFKEPDDSTRGYHWTKGSLDIIFKDNRSGVIKTRHISRPKYIYYVKCPWFYQTSSDPRLLEVPDPNNPIQLPYTELDTTFPVMCEYDRLTESIAYVLSMFPGFENEINIWENNKYDRKFLQSRYIYHPLIYNADMDIEDQYRMRFNRLFTNEPIKPTTVFLDIEEDTIDLPDGKFPDPGECPVNAVTLIDGESKQSITLLLRNSKYAGMEEFEESQKDHEKLIYDFMIDHVGGIDRAKKFEIDKFSYKLLFYDDPLELIYNVFGMINKLKRTFVTSWNMPFDIPHLQAAIETRGINSAAFMCPDEFPVKTAYYYHDVNEPKAENKKDFSVVSSYSYYVDQLITFAARRKGQKLYNSMKLNEIGQAVAGVKKLDYSKLDKSVNIRNLPYIDYKTFVYYNIADVICQYCIEYISEDMNYVYNNAMMSNTRTCKIHRQTTYLANKGIDEYYNSGFIMGANQNKANQKKKFPGAYVANPLLVSDKPKKKVKGIVTSLCDNCDDFDFTALYPSEMHENNMSHMTMIGKVTIKQDIRGNVFGNEYYDASVYFIEDYNSHDILEFCTRYLNLPNYGGMILHVNSYFMTKKYSCRGFVRPTNIETGYKIPAVVLDDGERNIIPAFLLENITEVTYDKKAFGGRPEWQMK